MSKTQTRYRCKVCGMETIKWAGKCANCGTWDSLEAFAPVPATKRSTPSAAPTVIARIDRRQLTRWGTGLPEWDRVVGGGLMPGGVVLLGGEPGIGKSTLLLQIAGNLLQRDLRVLYCSGEESPAQIALRADRLGMGDMKLPVTNETRVEALVDLLERDRPQVVMVDSIQTMYSEELSGVAGSPGQVREAAEKLQAVAKSLGQSLLLVGHITKEGFLAGPKMLEHIVDTVLYLEGDQYHDFRLLRAVKNRFGPTKEMGVFRMGAAGLEEVGNPSALFLDSRNPYLSGSIVAATMAGRRPLLAEVQALVTPTIYGNPQRNVTGFDLRRLQMLLAVLEKRAGVPVGNQDVFINIAGGLRLEEPAADLAVAVAVASSLQDRPVPATVVIGEIGLGGEIREVPYLEKRLIEARRLGFKRACIPRGEKADKESAGLQLVPVKSLTEVLEQLLTLSGDVH